MSLPGEAVYDEWVTFTFHRLGCQVLLIQPTSFLGGTSSIYLFFFFSFSFPYVTNRVIRAGKSMVGFCQNYCQDYCQNYCQPSRMRYSFSITIPLLLLEFLTTKRDFHLKVTTNTNAFRFDLMNWFKTALRLFVVK